MLNGSPPAPIAAVSRPKFTLVLGLWLAMLDDATAYGVLGVSRFCTLRKRPDTPVEMLTTRT
jgi:hypothetical protein